jgi:hypothetical protein
LISVPVEQTTSATEAEYSGSILFTVITQHLAEKTGGDIPTGGVIIFPLIGYRGMIPGGEMIDERKLATMPSTLHQSDILCQKGRDSSDTWRESQRTVQIGGAASGTVHQGEHPQRDIPFSIDVKGGEIVTLMWRDENIDEER